MADIDPRVPALQLLLADASDGMKRDLFYTAFPSSFVLLQGDAKMLGQWMRETRRNLQTIFDTTDGQTPLGMLAVQQVHHNADWAIRDLSKCADVLGVKIGTFPNPKR